MAKANQRITLTKRMLKEGLLRLLKTKQLDKINVTELCRESGINRATFYRHYEVPRDILTEMQEEFCEDLICSLRTPVDISEIISFFTRLYENADLVKLFIRYNTESDWAHIFNDLYTRIPDRRLIIPDAKNLDAESRKLLVTFISGGAYFMVRQWLMEDVPKTPAEIAELALKLIDYKPADTVHA